MAYLNARHGECQCQDARGSGKFYESGVLGFLSNGNYTPTYNYWLRISPIMKERKSVCALLLPYHSTSSRRSLSSKENDTFSPLPSCHYDVVKARSEMMMSRVCCKRSEFISGRARATMKVNYFFYETSLVTAFSIKLNCCCVSFWISFAIFHLSAQTKNSRTHSHFKDDMTLRRFPLFSHFIFTFFFPSSSAPSRFSLLFNFHLSASFTSEVCVCAMAETEKNMRGSQISFVPRPIVALLLLHSCFFLWFLRVIPPWDDYVCKTCDASINTTKSDKTIRFTSTHVYMCDVASCNLISFSLVNVINEK